MQYLIFRFFVMLGMLITASCGFHPYSGPQMQPALRTLILKSSEPYGPLAHTVLQQLRISNVNIVEEKKQKRTDVPTLLLGPETQSRDTTSVFRTGTTAEYQLVMTVTAQVLIPNKGIFPISTTIYRSFFDNPNMALAKDAEQDMLLQEMRYCAAEQLVHKLLSLCIKRERKDTIMSPFPLPKLDLDSTKMHFSTTGSFQ